MISAPRPLVSSEQGTALSLWQQVFGAHPGYFERYYDADPNYVVGDTVGIWDSDVLASAVHVCRRPVVWEGGALLCAGIANVATRDEYRRQGLSRQILARVIKKIEDEGYHYSLLGTGMPSHYSALGWERARRPQMMLTLTPNEVPYNEVPYEVPSDIAWKKATGTVPFRTAYSRVSRPLQFLRLPDYFEDWVGWEWRRQGAQIGFTEEGDYLVLTVPECDDQPLAILEWRARDAAAEASLLGAAAAQARERGRPGLWLDTLPQHLDEAGLQSLGAVTRHTEGGAMLRNVSLSPDDYARVAHAYQTGQAAWWPGDGF